MTDEKVKDEITEADVPDIVEAGRLGAKLSTAEQAAWTGYELGYRDGARERAALVEAAQPVVDCWGVGTLNITAMCEFVDALRQALAHHSAPVGEAAPGHTDLMVTPESIDAFMEVNPLTTEGSGTALHELTSRMMLTAHKLERGDLRALCNGGGSFDLVESAGFGGNANAFMASLLRQAISFLAPPTTPTSAPVEDVGGPRASGVSPTSAAIHALWFAEGIVSSSTWSDADKQATRDRFRQVEAELLRLSALIQPQGEERS